MHSRLRSKSLFARGLARQPTTTIQVDALELSGAYVVSPPFWTRSINCSAFSDQPLCLSLRCLARGPLLPMRGGLLMEEMLVNDLFHLIHPETHAGEYMSCKNSKSQTSTNNGIPGMRITYESASESCSVFSTGARFPMACG